MRLIAHRGTKTESDILSVRVREVKADQGTNVAMVETRLSCHPTPMVMMSTPESSNFIASLVISS